MTIEFTDSKTSWIIAVKTNRLAHIDSMHSGISRPHQELGFLAPPHPHSPGAEVHAEQPNLFEQAPFNSKACAERQRLGRPKGSCLDTMVKPNQHTIDQRQRLVANPLGLSLPPIRQNASAKVIGARKSTDCILISSQPPTLEPKIVVGK